MAKKILYGFLGFAILFIFWEVASSLFPSLLFVLPSPSNVARLLVENHERLFFHAFVTLKEMLSGILLALAASFPFAWAMVRYENSRAILEPFFITIQSLPMFTLAPLMVLWFGWSFTAIIVPTALMIFFPLTLNIYKGLSSTPSELVNFFKANGATSMQIFCKLRFPWALPQIFSGLRIASAISGIGAIAGEWAGAQSGLGILMLESRRSADLENTFAALFLLTAMSSLFYAAIVKLEKVVCNPKRKRLTGLFVALLCTLFFGLSGCHVNDKKPVRLLLDWLPNPNHLPLFVGLEKGFFAEEGIPLELLKTRDVGGAIPYLTSGQTELIINYMPGALRALGKGAKIIMVGALIKEPLSCLLYTKEGVETLSDLDGKRLGYCLGEPDTLFLDYLFKQGKIVPKERLNVSFDLVSSLRAKKVDFVFGAFWNIESAQLAHLGVETGYFPLSQMGIPPYYELIILANQNSLQATPLFIEKFQRALQRSIDFCRDEPEAAFHLYARLNPDKRGETLHWEERAWQHTLTLLPRDQSFDPLLIQNFKNFIQKEKLINYVIDDELIKQFYPN